MRRAFLILAFVGLGIGCGGDLVAVPETSDTTQTLTTTGYACPCTCTTCIRRDTSKHCTAYGRRTFSEVACVAAGQSIQGQCLAACSGAGYNCTVGHWMAISNSGCP